MPPNMNCIILIYDYTRGDGKMAEKFAVDYAAIGSKFREKRLSLNWSQETAAEKSGLSVGFYSNLERGTKILSVDSLIKIANALSLDLNYLFLDFLPKDDDEKLLLEIKNIFEGKTPKQTEYLINVFKLLSNNLDTLQP